MQDEPNPDAIKRYVITAPPGSDKRKIFYALQRMGEIVVPESARQYILVMKTAGVRNPWDHPKFQEHLLDLRLFYESEVSELRPLPERVWLDRSIVDSLAFAGDDEDLRVKIESNLHSRRRYQFEQVFFLESPGELMQKNCLIRETPEQATETGRKILRAYQDKFYHPIIIPHGTVDERVAAIMAHVN